MAVALLLLTAAAALGVADPPSATTLRDAADVLPAWTRPPAAILIVALLCCVLVPTPLLMIAAGLSFGAVPGAVVAVAGLTAAAVAEAAIGAQLPQFTARGRAMEQVDRAIRTGGWRSIVALRLAPGVPFALSNYALGARSARLTAIVAGTPVGVLPRAAVYATLGAGAGEATQEPGWTAIALLAIGALGLGVVLIPAARAQRRRRRARHLDGSTRA